MFTKKEYLEAKKKSLEYEMENIPQFYSKLILRTDGQEDDISYWDDIYKMSLYIARGANTGQYVHNCMLIAKTEWEENYLPF